MNRILLILSLLTVWSGAVQAQSTGQISGQVRDGASGEAVAYCAVIIEGSAIGASADEEGKYLIKGVKPGSYVLVASLVGYPTMRQPVTVAAGQTAQVDIKMAAEEGGKSLQEVEVTAQKRRDTDISLINDIRMATVVASGISSEQIARSVDRDAAQVVQRVPGITVQDNRFVVVRGLAQRYNQTQLNDVIAPSTEGDTRSFSFDLIPSSVLDRMLIFKSPTAEYPGDFAGGVVKLYTKSVVTDNFWSASVSGGYNTQATGVAMPMSVRSNTDLLGFDNGQRALPQNTSNLAVTSGAQYPDQIRKFNNNIKIGSATGAPDLRANLTRGVKINLARGVLTNLTSLSYSNAYTNIPQSQLTRDRYNLDLTPIFQYRDNIATRESRVGLIHNWRWQPSPRTSYEFRTFANQLGEDETIVRDGRRPADFSDPLTVLHQIASRYTQRTIVNSQVAGTHTSDDDRFKLTWTGGFNYLHRSEPDYRRLRQISNDGGQTFVLIAPASAGALEEAGRFYSNLEEMGGMHSMALEWRSRVFAGDSGVLFKGGYYLERKQRSFSARFFSYKLPNTVSNSPRGEELLGLPVNDLFQPENLSWREPGSNQLGNGFNLEEGTRPSDSYNGQNTYVAPYVSAQESWGKLTAILGLRFEYNLQQLQAFDGQYNKVEVSNAVARPLPSLNLMYAVGERALVRGSYGITLNRPEFRELAPFLYYDFVQDANFIGNPNLATATIHNADLRYEFYPSKGETISFGAFAKQFYNPIELGITQVGGTSQQYSYMNAATARTAGIEVELRKSLQGLPVAPWLRQFSFIFNAAGIVSNVDLGEGTVNQTRNRPLQGQSPYVLNAGVYYTSARGGWQASAIYNVSGKRIYAIGNNLFPTIYELPRQLVDLTLQKRISNKVELRASVSDLLNYNYRFFQDYNADGKITAGQDQVLTRYRRGSLYTLGVVANF